MKGRQNNIALLGMVFPFLFSDLLIKAFTANGIEATILFYSFYGASLLLTALLASSRLLAAAGGRVVFWLGNLFSLLLVLALLIFASSELTPPMPLLLVATVFAGIGITGNYQQWFCLYAKRPLGVAVIYLLIAFSISTVLRLLATYLALGILVPLAMVIVIIAQLLNYLASRSISKPTEGDAGYLVSFSTAGFERPIPFIICLIAYSIVFAILRSINFDSQFVAQSDQINFLLRIAFSLVMLFLILMYQRMVGLVQLSQISLICIISLILVLRFLFGTDTVLAVALVAFMRSIIVLFLMLTLILLLHRGRHHPYRYFGLGWGVYISAAGVGLLLSSGLNYSFLNSDLILNLVYILVAATLLPLLFRFGKPGDAAALANAQPAAAQAAISDEGLLEKRFGELREHFALSEQELNVMRMMRGGHSKRRIAAELLVSENTVRYYAKNLYVKLGVHNKEELLDVIGI